MATEDLERACAFLFAMFLLLWIATVFTNYASRQLPIVWRLDFSANRIAYLGAFFFGGALLHLNSDRLPLSRIFALLLIGCACLINDKNVVMPLLWFTIHYCAVVFAFRAPAFFQRLNGHDYSYGIYIYAFPVQQVVVQVLPDVAHYWLVSLIATTAITVSLAAISWHLIERPFLALR